MTLRPQDFESLLQANKILSSTLDIDVVLKSVLELGAGVVNAEASSLLLLDENKNELYFDVALGEAGEKVKQIRIKVGEGVAGWVAEKKEPLIVNDAPHDARFTAKVDKSTQFQTKSILAVPLLAKGKLVGVVEALNKKSKEGFTESDLEAFQSFAGQAGIAIANARLFSEVEREKQKLNAVFSEMSDGVVLLNDDQDIIFWNEKAALFLGIKSQEAGAAQFSEKTFSHFSFAPSLPTLFQENQTQQSFEMTRSGKKLVLEGVYHPIAPTKELPQGGALLLFRDVTEERAGEFLKKNFLSLISHKLRTPLTVIMGYGPVLLSNDENLDPLQKKGLQSICQQAGELSALVEKLLRFSVVESDEFSEELKPENLKDILTIAIRESQNVLKNKSARVGLSPDVEWPSVMVDQKMAIEAIKNLIENGVKFNKSDVPKVFISGELKKDSILVTVEDNGVGIPGEDLEKVFQKFYQVEESFTGQVPGAGLGLPFCKKVMESMGGNIRLESQLGKGTKALLTFKIG